MSDERRDAGARPEGVEAPDRARLTTAELQAAARHARRIEGAFRDLLATTWDFLEDCATREELRDAAVHARRRLEALL